MCLCSGGSVLSFAHQSKRVQADIFILACALFNEQNKGPLPLYYLICIAKTKCTSEKGLLPVIFVHSSHLSSVTIRAFFKAWPTLWILRQVVFVSFAREIHILELVFSIFCWLALELGYCLTVSLLFYLLCFTSSVNLTGFRTEDETIFSFLFAVFIHLFVYFRKEGPHLTACVWCTVGSLLYGFSMSQDQPSVSRGTNYIRKRILGFHVTSRRPCWCTEQ